MVVTSVFVAGFMVLLMFFHRTLNNFTVSFDLLFSEKIVVYLSLD